MLRVGERLEVVLRDRRRRQVAEGGAMVSLPCHRRDRLRIGGGKAGKAVDQLERRL
jgi:hypothetical protein